MNCRFCQTTIKSPFLCLGSLPLANSFLKEKDLGRVELFYPLRAYVCPQCFLVQVEEFEKPKNIFRDYAYYSSYSDTWLDHCRKYVDKVIKRFSLTTKSLVVEIASNDGYLLQYFKKFKIPILGIEPAKNIAKVARKKGIPTDITFFDTNYAKKMHKNNQQADLIIGNNVLAHNSNLNNFVEGLRIALKPQGIITLEFPHLLKLIKNNQFDTIYHEHFSYFSFYTVNKIFNFHGLELFDVDEVPTHGGSLRIYVKHKTDRSKKINSKVNKLCEKEKKVGLLDLKTYNKFSEQINTIKRTLLRFLINAKNNGKRIIGYGAPAKGNTLLNYCGIRTDFLDYTVDLNPAKQNQFLPGTHIPIKNPKAIKKDKPDYILILPWNLKDEIIKQLAFIKTWGGKFIIPIPKLEVI